mgnify:CR=1 FL=1
MDRSEGRRPGDRRGSGGEERSRTLLPPAQPFPLAHANTHARARFVSLGLHTCSPLTHSPPTLAPTHHLAQDIYSLFHLQRPFKFISKTSNFLIPIIGWSMFLTGKGAHVWPLPPASAPCLRHTGAQPGWAGRSEQYGTDVRTEWGVRGPLGAG